MRILWEDQEYQDGIRPESITVELKKNGESTGETLTLDESNYWYGSFTDLDVYTDGELNAYTIEEVDVADGYEVEVTHLDETTTYLVTNSHASETTEIAGTKIWEDDGDKDGVRPDHIIVCLMRGDEIVKTATVSAEEDWAWAFADLPKNENGAAIEYTIEEGAVDGYTVSITEDAEEGVVITNTYAPDETTPDETIDEDETPGGEAFDEISDENSDENMTEDSEEDSDKDTGEDSTTGITPTNPPNSSSNSDSGAGRSGSTGRGGRTGDPYHRTFWIVVLCAAGACIGILAGTRRQRHLGKHSRR